jgi:predicted CopG family antitoxin
MMSEEEVWEMLKSEKRNERRFSVLQRLHQRYNALRVARERIEILSLANKP